MADAAREYADGMLEDLAKRIRKEYSEALELASKQEFLLLEGYEARLAEMTERLEKGSVTQERFDKWKAGEAAEAVRLQGIVDQLAVRANASNETAAQFVSDELPGVFAESANWSAWDVQRHIGGLNAFSIVNEDAVRRLFVEQPDLVPSVLVDKAKDVAWNRQKFASAVTQSILLGESVDKLAFRISDVFGMNERHATMLARTAFTSAENGGREYTFRRATDMGIKMRKQWVATLDGRTRDSHRMLDGEIVEVGEQYSNGLEYPGDPSGPPEEVANCRCGEKGLVEGMRDGSSYSDMSTRWSRLPEGATYGEWKAGKYSGWEERARRERERGGE